MFGVSFASQSSCIRSRIRLRHEASFASYSFINPRRTDLENILLPLLSHSFRYPSLVPASSPRQPQLCHPVSYDSHLTSPLFQEDPSKYN